MDLKIDGISLRVVESENTGSEKEPSIVFVHGAGSDATVWNGQAAFLEGKYISYRIELPGHGGSTGSGEDDISAYTQWTRKVIKGVLNSRPYIFVGHSMGSAVAQELAVEPEGAMQGVVLVGAGARLGVAGIIFKMLEEDLKGFYKSIEQAAFAAETPRGLKQKVIEGMRTCLPSVILKDFKACNQFDIRERLKDINLPTLIVCGDQDQLTPVKYAEYLRENIEGSHFELIPKAGHMVMAEQAEVFNRVLGLFLEDLSSQ